jgi:hypothetical protein
MPMYAVRIAAILSLMFPAFTGSVAAQDIAQSDLCALEARSTSAERTATAQFLAEENPLKRTELSQAATKIGNQTYRDRLDFLGAKYGVLNTGEIDNMVGSRPFKGFTGKITNFLAISLPGLVSLSLILDCPQPESRSVIMAAQFTNATTTQWISDLIALREALLQIKAGSAVEFSGTIFVMANPRSPWVGKHVVVYWMKVIALRNSLSGATQGTATRPQ